MALGPSDPRQQKSLVACLLGVVLVFLMYQYVYSPRMTDVEVVAERVETLELSNQRARVLAARGGGDLEEQLTLYERHVMRLEELIPAGEEVPALLQTITAEGRRLGVVIAAINPQPELAGDFYTKKSYQIRTIGEFHALGQFLTAIASLPRIITPVSLEVSPLDDSWGVYQDLESPVEASFHIETYILPTGSPLPDATSDDPENPS